jgi:hypothetical protein
MQEKVIDLKYKFGLKWAENLKFYKFRVSQGSQTAIVEGQGYLDLA